MRPSSLCRRRHWPPRAALAAVALLPLFARCTPSDATGTAGPPVTLERLTAQLSVARGGEDTVRVLARDLRQQPVPTGRVRWRSRDRTIAAVRGTTGTAVVRGERRGTTTVVATLPTRVNGGGREVQIPVTVRGVDRLALLPSDTTIRVASRVTLRPVLSADSGISRRVRYRLTDGGPANQTSPDPLAARIVALDDRTITLAGSVPGTVEVTAIAEADSTVQARSRITVLPIRALEITPTDLRLVADSTATVRARVTIEAPLPASVTWTVRPRTTARITRRSGNVAIIHALTAGTAVVTATRTVDPTLRANATLTVRPSVRGVQITPSNLTLPTGSSGTLAATVVTDGALPTTVIWTSRDTSIAVVSAMGLVSARAPGQTLIVAQRSATPSQQAQATITVVRPTTLRLSPTNGTLRIHDRLTFVPTLTDGPANRRLLWRTTNAAIARVTPQGLVVGRGAGDATITAVLQADTSIRASALVNVHAAVRSVTVTPPSAALFIGDSTTLSVTVAADPGLATGVRFRRSDRTVATVSSSGRVIARTAGTTTIRASSVADTTVRGTSLFTVRSRRTTLTITPRPTTLMVPQTLTLTATVTGDPGIPTGVQWVRRQPTVAQVDAAGRVTALTAGTVRLVATAVADARVQDRLTLTVRSQLATQWTASRLAGPLIEDVVSVVHFSATDAFAVNRLGDCYRWNGQAWRLTARGSTYGTTLLSVHGTSASDVMAVGTNGVWLRLTGTRWQRVTTGSTATLHGVHVARATAAVAVGNTGTVLEWNGTAVRARRGTDRRTLHGAWTDGTLTVAVGENGRGWWITPTTVTAMSLGTTETLLSVAPLGAGGFIATGTFGTIRRITRGAPTGPWTAISPGPLVVDYPTVRTTATGMIYLSSDDGVSVLSGETLTPLPLPIPVRYSGLSVARDGRLLVGGQRGVTLRSAGGVSPRWTITNAAPDLLDVWSVSATLAWTVGEFGTIWQWNGRRWLRHESGTTRTLNAVWARDGSTAFAVGDDGTALRWTGSTWQRIPLPTTASAYSLMGFSSTEVYAGDTDGVIWRWNGSRWLANPVGTRAWWALHGTSGTRLMAGNAVASVARRTSGAWPATWSMSTVNGDGVVTGVWRSPSGTVFSAGANEAGTRAFFLRAANGTAPWTTLTGVTAPLLTSVWGSADDDVYATSDRGEIWRYDGRRLTPMNTGTTEYLWRVRGTPSGGTFAVGYNRTLVIGRTASSGMRVSSLQRAAATARRTLPRARPEATTSRLVGGLHRSMDSRAARHPRAPRRTPR